MICFRVCILHFHVISSCSFTYPIFVRCPVFGLDLYREVGITCFAMRSHMIATRRVTCDSAEWRRHVILPNGVACDCDSGVAGFESAVV